MNHINPLVTPDREWCVKRSSFLDVFQQPGFDGCRAVWIASIDPVARGHHSVADLYA